MSNAGREIIGVVGPRGAGKDTVADYFSQNGFMHISLSDLLRFEAARLGLSSDRPTLRGLGQELRNREGGGTLVVRAVESWNSQRSNGLGRLDISGHFTPGETGAVEAADGLITYVDAPEDIRFGREMRRKRNDAGVGLEDFRAQEKIEMYGLVGPNTPNLNLAKTRAQVFIDNSIDEPGPDFVHLHSQLAALL